jgi:hypothetical protein
MPDLGELRFQDGVPQFYLGRKEAHLLAGSSGLQWRKGAWISVFRPGQSATARMPGIYVQNDQIDELLQLPERTRIDWRMLCCHLRVVVIGHAIDDDTLEALLREADAMGKANA